MRDKFLTEAMGECWHMYNSRKGLVNCIHCGKHLPTNNNFSTWEGFGKLWGWAKEQVWFFDFCRRRLKSYLYPDYINKVDVQYIHPDSFADAVYKFLKERS